MTTVPSLPDPGPQSPEDRRAIGQGFIRQAREELEAGSRLQAGEKAWRATAHNLKAIGEIRGWRHESHQLVESIGRQIVAEYQDTDLGEAISEAYHKGHENFYENQRTEDTIREVIDRVQEMLPTLEALQNESPKSFTIASNNQLRRLINLTGNQQLQIGDTSPAGFSLRHSSNGGTRPESPEETR